MSMPTLNDTLADLGYTTRPGQRVDTKDILNDLEDVVFTGRAGEVWEWLWSKHNGVLWHRTLFGEWP